MTKLSSRRSPSPRMRDIETLENRQLFAGFVAHGPGFFPGLQPFAQFVEIDSGGVAIGYVEVIRFGSPASAGSGDGSGAASSANSAGVNRAVQSAIQSAVLATAGGQDAPAVAPRSILSTAAASTNTTANDANSAAALVRSDAAPATAIATTPAVSNATPAPTPIALPAASKIFSDRPVTLKTAAAAAPSGLPSLLNTLAPTAAVAGQAVAGRVHRTSEATTTDEAAESLPATKPDGPAARALATLPTGNFLMQPLWQRIAAASATVIILTANWMLRRDRKKSNIVRRDA